MRLSGRAGSIALALGAAVLALVAGELLLQWFPLPDPWLEVKRRRPQSLFRHPVPGKLRLTLHAEPGLPGVPPDSVFTTNADGFRGASLAQPKPAGEVRIFLVGGSAIECLHLDDSLALHALLQQRLRAASLASAIVLNAGRSGECSFDHLALVLHRIVHLEPDLIVVMAGVNDLLATVRGVDYTHRPSPEAPPLGFATLAKMTLSELQLARRLRALVHRPAAQEAFQEVPLVSKYRQRAREMRVLPVTDAVPPPPPPAYRRNLVSLAAGVVANGQRLLFVTQPSAWGSRQETALEWHWMLAFGGRRFREDRMDAALESYNDVMREVARRMGVPLCDVAPSTPKTLDHFYDDVHFNVGGARALARALAECIAAVRRTEGPAVGAAGEATAR